MLFIKILLESDGALKWIEKYINNITKSRKSPAQLEVLTEAMNGFRVEKGKKTYYEAMQLWQKSPQEAIKLLFEAKYDSREAKEKLEELRQSKSYKNPKKAKVTAHGRILRKTAS
jgi:hypothetical protein